MTCMTRQGKHLVLVTGTPPVCLVKARARRWRFPRSLVPTCNVASDLAWVCGTRLVVEKRRGDAGKHGT